MSTLETWWREQHIRVALELFLDNREEDMTPYTTDTIQTINKFERENRAYGCRPCYDIEEALVMMGDANGH